MSAPTDCPAESARQSEHSPSVVGDDEALVYILLSPDLYNIETRTMDARAFSKSKLREGTLSVCRAEHTSIQVAEEQVIAPQIARKPERSVAGALTAICGAIRCIRFDAASVRTYCVVDDGREDFTGHAHIGFSPRVSFSSQNSTQAARGNLLLAFESEGGPKPLAQVFPA
jgi:hypothetical protein